MMVYSFKDGDGKNKQLLGGKGAGLSEMTQIGLPVPPGFVITTEVCIEYNEKQKKLPNGLIDEVKKQLVKVENETGKKFGDFGNPLLVSVRSGAAMSMPGMMDTILNLGLNSKTVQGLIEQTNDERFAYDCYRRFIQLFSKIAMNAKEEPFDEVFEKYKEKYNAKFDTDLTADALKEIVTEFKQICKKQIGEDFPEDPFDQLQRAIEAVFDSWMGKRAIEYRRINKITPEVANGTAVNVQTMVFGNMGSGSGTGVAFTRDPGIGKNEFYGEYLPNAQGEDVVAGIRTPKPISEMRKDFPKIYEELRNIRKILEQHYKEVQDFEFTIEKGKLYMLQTRNGKMTTTAAIKTSVDMFNEGLLSKRESLLRIIPENLEQILHKRIDPNTSNKPVAGGIAASPGAASGKAILDADTAAEMGNKGEKIILVREETKPDDVHGFAVSQGILTSRGGKTSHAAVVARGMGKPCVTGSEDVKIDMKNRTFKLKENIIKEGELITIDGSHGDIYIGKVSTVDPILPSELQQLLSWADDERKIGIRANVDTPEGAKKARDFGAEGIGLCRTERMFNAADRLPIVQKMIMAETKEERSKYLSQLMPLQKNDFIEILKAMNGLPVTIRLLDPPLHEFLPSLEQLHSEIDRIQKRGDSTEDKEKILEIVRNLTEVNPMLGHRGVRLGITDPEIYEMQVRAIIEACVELKKQKYDIKPEIMIPQVSSVSELALVRDRVEKIANEIMEESGVKINYSFGTMIEVVRSCLTANKIANIVEFFSFGTNDLTQGTFSFSREDAENKFLPRYLELKIMKENPFEVLDFEGVGRLMDIAVKEGRSVRPKLKVGICGEHGGEPNSVKFCYRIGLDYVSCSVYRVPVARLAAAQEVIIG
ncbi:MAG: pyruvate, phosphate dikinase [Candidatus Bathyarchaeota archaeon]|nr:pyruvate, phosphate dikinase [Candidatus Bathyarchaeota archaeon]MCZ2845484.1 pyruvate, phosphate dikinase [Candidatus Bathyarchaeota archaeon]